MVLPKTILRPAARLAGLHAAGQVRSFLAAHRRTAGVQEALLRRLLAAAAGSQFARDHSLERVRSYRDFTSAVPVGDYETHRPYVRRVMAGEAQALFRPGTEIVMFAVTSGTTGAPKHIPVTRRFLREYRRGWNVFGLLALRDHPDGWLRRIVTITSSPREALAPGGAPCGVISGLLAETQKWIVRRMYPVPPPACQIADPDCRYYVILRSSAAHDVGILTTANPSSAVKLAETGLLHAERLIRDVRDGTLTPPGELSASLAGAFRWRPDPAGARRLQHVLDRHGQLLPRHFWRLSFLAHWTGGTLGLYLPGVRRCYGDVPIRDIGLLASEGRLTVPLHDHTPAGVAEITSNFLEFIPAGQVESARPDVLLAHELERGQEYFLVLTNWAGLWRYNIDDRVRVTGRLGDSPVLEFLSKGLHTSSITGEKITEHQVVQAMADAAGGLAVPVERFLLQGHFDRQPYYLLSVEAADGPAARHLAGRLDEALRRVNVEYDGKRAGARLGPIRACCLPPGSLARREADLLAARHGRLEQYKHTYLLTEVVNDIQART